METMCLAYRLVNKQSWEMGCGGLVLCRHGLYTSSMVVWPVSSSSRARRALEADCALLQPCWWKYSFLQSKPVLRSYILRSEEQEKLRQSGEAGDYFSNPRAICMIAYNRFWSPPKTHPPFSPQGDMVIVFW